MPDINELMAVMGESESRLGFKSRFERFLGGMIRQILGLIRHERLGFDSILYFLRFDSKRGIRQPNLSQLLRREMLRQQQADPSS